MEPDRALGWSAVGRSDCGLSTRKNARWTAAALRVHGDAQRRLLCRLRYEALPASSDAAGHRDERQPAHAISWRSAAAARTHQVRLQADQTYRAYRLHRSTAGRLLDQAGLRLVRGALS